jgi:hypothetical protein
MNTSDKVGYIVQNGTDYLQNVPIVESQTFLNKWNEVLPELRMYGYSYEWQMFQRKNIELINDLYDYLLTNDLIQ